MIKQYTALALGLLMATPLWASVEGSGVKLELTHTWVGYLAIGIFVFAYIFVILEEKIHLRKSKPVLLAAGLIWILIALVYNSHN